MSNEQLLGLTANNLLCPNQTIPQSSNDNWLEPLGLSSQVAGKTTTTGQLPLFTINCLHSNISVLVGNIGQSTDPFVPFTNYSAKNFLTNTPVTLWQFQPSTVDNDSILVPRCYANEEIDPVRQKITAASQKNDLVGQSDSSLTKVIDIAQQQIASFFQQPDVENQLALAFGQGVDPEMAKSYGQQLPNIEIVPDSILGKANGAYAASTNTIFLAHSLVARGDQQEIIAVLTEEIGHSIDAHINNKDSTGDEGEIFANLVSDHLNQADYLVMLAEDDHNQILWQGQALDVENAASNNFTIRAVGKVKIQGNNDLDGQPLDLQDDALIYAGKGFSIQGNTILPVRRDINGNPLRDSNGKLILVDRAVAVSASRLRLK